ncbi:MAG: terminase family protein [Patescibacteria group bacterium]|nr:terminase family protein [Patescibacteria group bacterium]
MSNDRAALVRLLMIGRELKRRFPWRPMQRDDGSVTPQQMAYDSEADIVGYGGAAGGGKTDLMAGLAILKHERTLIVRREKAQTEGIVQRIGEILESTTGYNSQKSIWKIPDRGLVEFGGLDNLGDERRFQGRAHDLKAIDEATECREAQVRFIIGWNRTSNPKIKPKVLMTFNPPTTAEGRWVISFFAPWLDKKHPMYPVAAGELRYAAMLPDGNGGAKDVWLERGDSFVMIDGVIAYEFNPADYTPEQIIKPKSRTFIPARVTDNHYYMATDYMSTLQALPEPLRSQMLYGDFQAGIEDDAFQLIPTEWVEAAQARWKELSPKPEMDSLGVDVARGGKDMTILAPRHGNWYDRLKKHAGTATPDGPIVAGLCVAAVRDGAPIHIDVIGVGSSPYDFLNNMGIQVVGVNVAEKAIATDKTGRLRFMNLRSQLHWQLREDLDPANNTGIALPPDSALLAALTAPRWRLRGAEIQVESRDEIIARIGRSPDELSAIILARMDTPKVAVLRAINRRKTTEYDPYA